MPAYKMHYFDVRGRGEMIRMTLAAAGIEFEDIRHTLDTWKEFKPKTPSGKLPLLKIDEYEIFESHAILRHIARENDLYGKTIMDKAWIDAVLGACEDVAIKLRPTYFEKDETKLAEAKKVLDERMLVQIPILEYILTKNNGGKGWMIGEKMTIADIVMHTTFEGYEDVLKKESDVLWKHRQRVADVDKIKAYLKDRPQRPM